MASLLDFVMRPHGRHAVTEAAPVKAQTPATKTQRAGFAFGVPPGGLDEDQAGIGASTQTDRKSLLQELYEAYLSCPWAWAAVQSIARTITAGGIVTDWTGDDQEGDQEVPDKPDNVLALEALLAFCNPQQNIRQLLRNFIADLLVFGDAYIEVVWVGTAPVALYNQDSPTTTPVADVHGNISRYVQVTDYGQRAVFEPREIIHVTLDAARPGVTGISPMQAALGPVTAWLFAQATGKEAFKKGLPPNIQVDFPAAAQDKDIRRWRDQYFTRNIGAKNIGTPITSQGGVGLKELQTGKIADIIAGKNQARDEILAIFGVPPAKAGVIESGNLGGGTGEAQDKTYRVDTCGPIEELVIDAFTYALAQQAFGIQDWVLKFGEVDYRDSQIIEGIRDTRLRNGSWTLNRYRQEIGEPPVDGGDDAVLIDRQNLVIWADMSAMSKANVAAKAGKGAEPGQPGEEPDGSGPGTQGPGDGAPAEPGPDGLPAGPGAKPAESVAAVQLARYHARLRHALGRVAEAAQTPADAVYDQLAENFPPKAIAWVKDADWSGPHAVPIDHVDTDDRDSWAASDDHGRVRKFRKKLRKRLAEGRHPKPIVLVRKPGKDKDRIVDGHHHFLAAEQEGEPTVWAFVGRVPVDDGPWDETHSSQERK